MTLSIYSGLVNSPLWYLSRILDTFEWNHDEKSGIFYYGSKNHIYFFKMFEVNDKMSKISYETKIHFFMKGHIDIVGVCTISNGISILFKNERILPKFASCGKDKLVRIWSFNEITGCCCLKEFNLSSTRIKTNPTCISVNSSNTVLCGFEKGSLFSWNYLVESEHKEFHFGNQDIGHIVWNENKFAVGFKNGDVVINEMKSYDSVSQLSKFRAHNSEVCSISWNPLSANVDQWGDLATVGKDRKVKLWKIDKNHMTKNHKTLTLPTSRRKINAEHCGGSGGAEEEKSDKQTSNWSSLCWSMVNGGLLIVTTGFGNIGTWQSPNSTELKFFSQNHGIKNHGKSVFGITEFRHYDGLLVSHSHDRIINVSKIDDPTKDGECVLSFTTLGGPVSSLDATEQNNQLAVGCYDKMIRLWRYDSFQRKGGSDVTNVWEGVGGKCLAISWHPTLEGLLAFGTDVGEVGFVKVTKAKKEATLSQMRHTNKVFVITWALDIRRDYHEVGLEEKKNSLVVYSVGNYSLVGHDFQRNDFFDVSGIVSDGVVGISDFVMDDLLKYFAVGYANGLVNIYAVKCQSDLTLVCQIKTHTKGINCMRWCPVRTDGVEQYRLAVGSNERFLTVTDLNKVVGDFEASARSEWAVVEFNETLAMFKGHGDRITGVDWCPFDTNRLVTSSYDHTAFVWSISDNAALVSFNQHHGRVFCCKWSRRDPDLIYTGGDDSNLFAWRPSQQTLKSELNRRRHFVADVPGVSHERNKTVDGEENVDGEDSRKPDVRKDQADNVAVESDKTKPLFTKKRPSLFPTTIFAHHPLELYQNAVLDFIDGRENYLPCLALLDSRAAIVKLLEVELTHHKDEKNFENYFLLLIWAGKVGRVVSESLSMGYSPDWLMALIFGYTARDVPDELVTMMVNNTVNNKKDPILAATYWLAMSQSKRAIEVLVKSQLYREALILTKLRLPPNDASIPELLAKLKGKYFKNGSYEFAAVCSLLLKDFKGVFEAMNRRPTKLAGWVTIQILIKHNQEEMLHHCVFNFVNWILMESMNETVEESSQKEWTEKIRSTEHIAFYSILSDLHRWIWIEKKSLKEIWDKLKTCCQKYQDKMTILQNQIHSKLVSKQINQDEHQICLYLTYEMLLIIISNIYNENFQVNDGVVLFGQLNDSIKRYRNISLTGCSLINQLVGSELEEDEQIIKLITNNLLDLKLQDS